MLEELKQLQVTSRASRLQLNICNEKSRSDWPFLGSAQLGRLSYRQAGKTGTHSLFWRGLKAPAVSSKPLQGLELFAMYLSGLVKHTAFCPAFFQITAQLEKQLKKPPRSPKPPISP